MSGSSTSPAKALGVGAAVGSIGGPGMQVVGALTASERARKKNDKEISARRNDRQNQSAHSAQINQGFHDFGGDFLAPTQHNLDLLERSQTTGSPKPFLFPNVEGGQFERIKQRGSNIHERKFTAPGRRQSLLQDILPFLKRMQDPSARARQQASQAQAEALANNQGTVARPTTSIGPLTEE